MIHLVIDDEETGLNWKGRLAIDDEETGLNWKGCQQSLDWTGLEKIVSNTDNSSIGLGWKRSSKNKCNFVALSLQLVREDWNTNCTLVIAWNSHSCFSSS